MNFNQVCIVFSHTNEPIIGYCLSLECQDYPQYCSQCILEKHQSHRKDCKSIIQMMILINEYTKHVTELSQRLDDDNNMKQQEYHSVIKFLQFQQYSMQKLEEKLKNQEFEELTINCKILKEIYNFEQNQIQNNKQINMPGDLLKYMNILWDAYNKGGNKDKNDLKQDEIKISQEKSIMEEKNNREQQNKIAQIPQGQYRIATNTQGLQNFLNSHQQLLGKELGIVDQRPLDFNGKFIRQKEKQFMIVPDECNKYFKNHLKNFKFKQGLINEPLISESIEIFSLMVSDDISFFYCQPDILEDRIANQRIKVEDMKDSFFIGVCYKKMYKKTINKIIFKKDSNGYFFIKKYYSDLAFSNPKFIEIEVNRLENKVYFKMPEPQEHLEINIPEKGILKLFFGLQFGRIELIQE